MKLLFLFLSLIGIGEIMGTEKQNTKLEKATFAGGCFWCMEPPFEKLTGVTDVVSGYMGGTGENPTYQDYADKGHVEVVQVTYDPQIVSYNTLLDVFWRNIDPTDAGGQFVDRGRQYRSVIFYYNEDQKEKAITSKDALEVSKRFPSQIVTEILPASTFYKAEDYHQDYAKTNPIRYKYYRYRSGRDQFLNKYWNKNDKKFEWFDKLTTNGKEKSARPDTSINSAVNASSVSHSVRPDTSINSAVNASSVSHSVRPELVEGNGRSIKFTKPSDKELHKKLTPLQYKVTQQNGTEPAFNNKYWDNKKEGIYVDIVSGEPLFSSKDKYKSGTGWPSFTKPLKPENIVEQEDRGWFSVRTEVRSKHGDSHLGHVFKDGPPPTGLRYCLNSAALRFVPVEDLEKEGYGQYLELFKKELKKGS